MSVDRCTILETLKNSKWWSLKPIAPNSRNISNLNLCDFLSFCPNPNPISDNFHFHSSFDPTDLVIEGLSRRWIPIFWNPASSDSPLALACLFTSWWPKPYRFLRKTFKEANVEADLHIFHQRLIFERFLETEVELAQSITGEFSF